MLKKEEDILSVREQYELRNRFLEERLQDLLPDLMEECGVNLWVVLCSEYHEDPVFRNLTPAKMQHASRLSCLMFSMVEGEFKALSLCRPNVELAKFYEQAYDPKAEDQWEAIRRVLEEHADGVIAVNVSSRDGMNDGLSKRLWEKLAQEAAECGAKLTEDHELATRFLETRTETELEEYPGIYQIAMAIQAEAYSRDVITPGVTTTSDVEWYILQRINDMGLSAWFSPDVDVQRKGVEGRLFDEVIQEGDLIHTDMGISYLGLCTDSQRLGYVLKEGEEELPDGIREGFYWGTRFQDIVCENMEEDRTGNEIFEASIERAKKSGIRPMLYTHPIGAYGHGAGPLFGLYDNQGPIEDRGEIPLKNNTCYALELNVVEKVPEWDDQDVFFYMEETIAFVGDSAVFLDAKGRSKITLI